MRFFLFGFSLLSWILFNSPAHAAESGDGGSLPVSINFAPGVQVASGNQSVVGFRTGSYGSNKNMFGVDVALLGSTTDETFGGIAVAGLLNTTGKSAYVVLLQLAGVANLNHGKAMVFGFQIAGVVNTVGEEGKVYGGQIAALVNYAPKTDVVGFQLGLFNRARRVVGFQIGLLNFADDLKGIQLGFLNFNYHAVPFKMFPVINVGF